MEPISGKWAPSSALTTEPGVSLFAESLTPDVIGLALEDADGEWSETQTSLPWQTEVRQGHIQLADLLPLMHLTALQNLNLTGTQITGLSPLSELTSLTELDLSGTAISDEEISELEKALPNCLIVQQRAATDASDASP